MIKKIIYSCPYVPAEWIAAHSLRPCRVLPNAVPTGRDLITPVEGVCPYVRSFINEVTIGKDACGVVVTTVCDQMRRAYDILVRKCDFPVFLMNVPKTWQRVGAQKLYLDELKRLGQFLVKQGGKVPSKDELIKVMLEYDAARASIRASRMYLSSRQYCEAIADFNCKGRNHIESGIAGSKPLKKMLPLCIIGGPLLKEDFEIFDIIEDCGGRIVLDATETGERGMCASFDRRRIYDDALLELSDAYFNGIQDASRRPNSELYKWLKRQLIDRAACGIIFRRYVWCDLWHAELERLKDWVGLPVLDIEMDGNCGTHHGRTANRIRTFLEMLK